MAKRKGKELSTSMPTVPELTLVQPRTEPERAVRVSTLLLSVALVAVVVIFIAASGLIGYAVGRSERVTITSVTTRTSVSVSVQTQIQERWGTVTVTTGQQFYPQYPPYYNQNPYYQQGYTVTVTLYSANPNLSPTLQAYQLSLTPASVPMMQIGFNGNRYTYRGTLTTLTLGASYILRISGGNCPLWLQPITLNGPLTYTTYGTP